MKNLQKFKSSSKINITKDIYDELMKHSPDHSAMYVCWYEYNTDKISVYVVPKRGMNLEAKGIVKLYQDNTLVIDGSILEKLTTDMCLVRKDRFTYHIVPFDSVDELKVYISLEV